MMGVARVVVKDHRINILGKKMAEFNEVLSTNKTGYKMVRGYRLMLLSTSDRNQAMSARSKVLQLFPDQKVYMTFQSPFIKLKFGNFEDKSEAERYRKQVASLGIVQNNIYLVPDMVEVKVEKIELSEE
ncbi:MAG: SPOR domain-containing protein, partial [Ferruginibacter sp.]